MRCKVRPPAAPRRGPRVVVQLDHYRAAGSGPVRNSVPETPLAVQPQRGHIRCMDRIRKRPRDPNQLAKFLVDIVAGDIQDREPTPEERGKDPAAVKRGRLGGIKGGKARAAKMTPAERKASALKAIKARWSRTRPRS